MRMRRLRSFTEACVFGGCLVLILFSLVQVLLINSRSRPSRAVTDTQTKETKTAAHDEQRQKQLHPDIGMIRQRDALKRALAVPASSAAKAKLHARTKAQQEVRELERSLVKLMRQNSRTPEQSKAEMQTELYGLRVGRIIQQVAMEATKQATTSQPAALGEDAGPDDPFSQSRSTLNSNGIGVIASQRRAFSDISQSEHQNRSHPGQNRPGSRSAGVPYVPSDINSASWKHGHPVVDNGFSSRTMRPYMALREMGRTKGTGTRRIASEFVLSKNLTESKEELSLSERSSVVSTGDQQQGGMPHKKTELCSPEPFNLGKSSWTSHFFLFLLFCAFFFNAGTFMFINFAFWLFGACVSCP